MGGALIKMRDEVGDTFLPIQVHQSDNYVIGWGTKRASFYTIPGFPTYIFDSLTKYVGAENTDKAQFDKIKGKYDDRRGKATDVTVQLWAEQDANDEQTWTVTAHIGVEDGGTTKDIRVHIVQLQDKYPTAEKNPVNCATNAMTQKDINVQAGQFVDVTWTVKIADKYWDKETDRANIKFCCLAQTKKDKFPAEMYNAAVMNYPFSPPPPKWQKGDMNCSSTIDFDDIDPFVTALIGQSDYETEYPDCEYGLADINDDKIVNFDDIDPFVELLTR